MVNTIDPYRLNVGSQRKMATKSLMLDEISSSRSDIYAGYGFMKYNPDLLVGKKGLEIYQKMKSDDQIKACLTVKKFARLSTPWEIKSGDKDDNQSVEMAEFIKHVFVKMKGTLERNILNILTAIEYGFSISEKVYGIIQEGEFRGKIGLKKIASREPFGYDFKTDEHGNILGIVCEWEINSEGLGSVANPYPEDKFIIYSYNAEHDNPYGQSDLRAAYRPFWSKDLNIKWWNIFNERFGTPTVMASYPAKMAKGIDKGAINEIDDILKNLQVKSGFRIPDNIKFELLEATRRGEAGYGAAIDKYDLMIARAILVPSLLGFTEQTGGSYALGKKHFDVFMFVLNMLGRDIEETIVDEQIIAPLIKLNYGEVSHKLIPKFKFESLEGEDTEAKAKVVKILADARLIDKREDWVRSYLSVPERDIKKYPHMTPIGEAQQPIASQLPNTSGEGSQEGGNGKPLNPKNKDGTPPLPPKKKQREFTFSREANKFEEKVSFQSMEQGLNTVGESLKSSLQTVLKKWETDLLKKAKKILDSKSYAEINKLKLRGVGDFKGILRNYTVKIHLDSKLHGLEEVQTTGFPVTVTRKFELFMTQTFQIEPWEPVDTKEAVDLFNRKVIAVIKKEDGKKKLFSLANMSELTYYDKKAFAIAGIEHDYIIKEAQMALMNGLKNETYRETMNSLRKIFEKYIDSGEIRDGVLVNPSRLETIVRTNLSDALNQGRVKMFTDPEVDDFVPYYMWSSILDSRISDYCFNMDGKIFRKGEVIPPPSHYNCRSVIVPITQSEIETEGGVELSNWNKENAKTPRATGFVQEECLSLGLPLRIEALRPGEEIERCPLPGCDGTKEDITLISEEAGTKTYICKKCYLKFRVTAHGDLYFWDAGKEEWIKQTIRAGGFL